MRLALCLCALIVHFGMSITKGDMITATNDPAATDRFYSGANPDFVFSQYNFTGVGNTGGANGAGQWATMISDTFFISANHYHPVTGADLTFYSQNGTPYTAVVGGGEAITAAGVSDAGDLYLGWLSAPIPVSAGISSYHVAPDDANALSGASLVVVGIPWRVGTGIISELYGNEATTFAFSYNPGVVGGKYAAFVEPGDSGAPSFIVAPDGSLEIVGTHWMYTGPFEPGYNASIDSFISPGVSAFDAAMAALGSNEQAIVGMTATPEPSSLALMAIGLASAVVAMWRRRRQAVSPARA